MIATLSDFAFRDKLGEQGIPHSVRFAAACAIRCMQPIQSVAEENWRLARAVLGDFNQLPFDVAEAHRQELIARGAIGWDPQSWELAATWTPTVENFCPYSVGTAHKWVSKTVVFTESYARPLVVACLRTLIDRQTSKKQIPWELFQMTIFTVNEHGEDFDRPYVICPQRNLSVLL